MAAGKGFAASLFALAVLSEAHAFLGRQPCLHVGHMQTHRPFHSLASLCFMHPLLFGATVYVCE